MHGDTDAVGDAKNVTLPRYSPRHDVFTGIAFETVYPDDPQGRRVFVASEQGSVLQIHGPTKELQVIYRVHSAPITSILVNESFCVTGSRDAYVRVWPLDFSDYFLEAHHDAPITSVDASSDGLYIAIGTEQGAVGLLEVGNHVHRNILRSHSSEVTGLSVDVHDSMVATASSDGTMRVWSLRDPQCQQLYEIEASDEAPRCACFRPDPAAEAAHVACGFNSGTVRVFVVEHTKLLHEFCQHQSGVFDICFGARGSHMVSLGLDDNVCVYDANANYQPMKFIPIRGPLVASSWLSNTCSFENVGMSLAVSADSQFISAVSADGSEVLTLVSPSCQKYATLSVPEGCGRLVSTAFCVDAPVGRPPLLFAVTSNRKLVRLDLKTGDHVVLAETGRTDCRSLAVSCDGKLVAVGDAAGYIKLWSYSENKLVAPPQIYNGHVGAAVNRLVFDNRGYHLLSVGEDSHVMLWSVTPAQTLSLPPSGTAAPTAPHSHTGAGEIRTSASPEAETAALDCSVEMCCFGPPTVACLDPQTLLCCEPAALAITALERKITRSISSSRLSADGDGNGWALFAVDPTGKYVAAAEGLASGADLPIAEIEPFMLANDFTSNHMVLPKLRYHSKGIAALEFIPAFGANGAAPLLVSAGVASGGALVVWDILTGSVKTTGPISLDFGAISVLKAFQPDGAASSDHSCRFFVGAGGTSLTIWSLSDTMELTCERLHLPVHTDTNSALSMPAPIVAIAAVGDSRWAFGSLLASHSASKGGLCISLWDVDTLTSSTSLGESSRRQEACRTVWQVELQDAALVQTAYLENDDSGPNVMVGVVSGHSVFCVRLKPPSAMQDGRAVAEIVRQTQVGEVGAGISCWDFNRNSTKGVVRTRDNLIHFVDYLVGETFEIKTNA
eukprot:SAG31_NODE_457_length_15415_cov_4.380387_2_plen_898_part_00